jgi:ABC-2 type transport system permease protein
MTPKRPICSYLLMFVLYMAFAMTSGFMLQSVSREKENRTAEVLLVSLKPRDLMFGKIAGLSTVGLIQVAVWLTVIFGVFLSQDTIAGIDFALSGEVAVRVIPWTFVYFLLGYLMYASIYSVLGVLSPTARDANQFVFVAIVPLVIPLLFVTTFTEVPDGALATTLSLFPLTSPVAMVARLGAGSVPWWQLAVGAAALAILAYLFVLLAGRLFRASNLLSNRGLTWTRLKTALLPG